MHILILSVHNAGDSPWQEGGDTREHLCLGALFSLPILAGPLEVVISPSQLCLTCPQAITAAAALTLTNSSEGQV